MAPFWGLRGSRLQAAIWAEAFFSVMIFGFNQSSAGGVLSFPTFNDQFPRIDTLNTVGTQKADNARIQGTVVATYTLFGVFGALACTFGGDKIGRRKTIFSAIVTQSLGAILQASSTTLAQFIVGRAFLGLGTGGLIATISVWQAELSPAESRGSHVAAFGLFTSSGHAVALWLAFGMSYTQPSSVSWRLVLAGSLFFSIIGAGFIFTLPESPRWLGNVDRWEEARATLACLYDDDPGSDQINTLVRDIHVSLELSGRGRLNSLFRMDRQRTLHRVVLAVVLQMFLQMNGINSIVYYTPTIFRQQLGFSSTVSRILAASSQLSYVAGAIVCSWTVDRFGRRNLMFVSATLMCVCFASLAGTSSDPNNEAALKSSAFFIFFYLFVYVLGFLGIPFLYASEIAPVRLRAAICGISTATSWLFNFLVAEVTPTAFTNLGHWYFLVFAGINAICVPTVYFFYPETAKRSLEEIDEIFVASKSDFDTVRVARNLPRGHLADIVGGDGKEKGEAATSYKEDIANSQGKV